MQKNPVKTGWFHPASVSGRRLCSSSEWLRHQRALSPSCFARNVAWVNEFVHLPGEGRLGPVRHSTDRRLDTAGPRGWFDLLIVVLSPPFIGPEYLQVCAPPALSGSPDC